LDRRVRSAWVESVEAATFLRLRTCRRDIVYLHVGNCRAIRRPTQEDLEAPLGEPLCFARLCRMHYDETEDLLDEPGESAGGDTDAGSSASER